jgi:hypothetical protein
MIASFVSRLIAAGTPPEVAATVVAEAFAAGVLSADCPQTSVDETAERRRAKDRDRKRLNRGCPQKSADVGGNPQKSADTLLNLSSLSSLRGDQEKKESKKLRSRGQLLSADFQPKPAHYEAAKRLGYPNPEQAVAEKFEDMRLWAESKGVMRPGWDATLHGFLRRDAYKATRGTPNGSKPNLVDAAKKLANTFADRPGSGLETGGNLVRLLPQGGRGGP